MLENVFCGKVVLLGIKKIHGLHDGLKSLETKINRGRYRVPKFANEFVRTRKNGINTNFWDEHKYQKIVNMPQNWVSTKVSM